MFDIYLSYYICFSDGTALGGDENDFKQSNCDYEHIEEGLLQFQSGQTSQKIMIKINPMAKVRNWSGLIQCSTFCS